MTDVDPRHTTLIDPETGEVSSDAPAYPEALRYLDELRTQIEMMDRDLKGKRLRIARLEADRDAAAQADPLAPIVDVIHACWKRATNRRRPLDFNDRERIGAALRKLGLAKCLAAVGGAGYDPNYSNPRRNGKRERFDDLELVFRTFGHASRFAARVPDGWAPDPEKVAAIAGVDPEWIRAKLDDIDAEEAYADDD